MAEYSRLAKGNYVVSGGTLGSVAPSAKIINLPFKPDYVELINLTQAITPAQHGVPFAFWDASVNVTVSATVYNPTIIELFNATPVLTTDSVLTNGISAFSAGQMLQYGARIQISGITKANPAVVTTASAHGYSSGDVVIFQGLYQSATTGMAQIAGIPFTVTVTGATTFTIPWNTNQSNYTALSASPSGAFVKKVLYPYLYQPGVSFISAITTGSTTTIDTTDGHNFVVGQEVALRIPAPWATTQFNSLPNVNIPGSPIYAYVIAVTDYNTVVLNVDSTAFTAFNSNQTIASVPGLSWPQIVAVGDVNTGGVQISSGSALYPPPYVSPIGTTRVNSINGPAIQGAFFNNTSQGFIIGNGASHTDTASWFGGSDGDVIEWRAFLHDYSSP